MTWPVWTSWPVSLCELSCCLFLISASRPSSAIYSVPSFYFCIPPLLPGSFFIGSLDLVSICRTRRSSSRRLDRRVNPLVKDALILRIFHFISIQCGGDGMSSRIAQNFWRTLYERSCGPPHTKTRTSHFGEKNVSFLNNFTDWFSQLIPH